MATVAEFRAKLPQFTVEQADDLTVQAWLDTAARSLNEDDYGADYDDAHIYLTAHLMSMAGIGPEKGAAAMGGLKSFTSGSVSMTKDDKGGFLGLTSFGRLFQPLVQGVRGGPRVTGTGDYPYPYGGPAPELP